MIQIEEHCRQDLKFLRVPEWDARTTVTRADAEDVLDFDGPVVTICEKEHGGGLRLIAITTATSAKTLQRARVFFMLKPPSGF